MNDSYTPREDRDHVLETLNDRKEILEKKIRKSIDKDGENNHKAVVLREKIGDCRRSMDIVIEVFGIGNKDNMD